MLLWPTVTVNDVDRTLAFYRDTLGFEQDMCLRDRAGKAFIGSVEVGETVIMFESPNTNEPTINDRGIHSGIKISILLPETHNIDSFYSTLRDDKGVPVCAEIGDRPWGNRDFAIRDPDGYLLVFARSLHRTDSHSV